MTPEDDEIRRVDELVRQRQGRQCKPKQIKNVVGDLLARRGYARVQSAFAHQKAWNQAVGGPLSRASRPGNVRRGVLEVFVRNSTVLQEMSFQKRQILRRLAELLPDEKINDLRFRVGPVD